MSPRRASAAAAAEPEVDASGEAGFEVDAHGGPALGGPAEEGEQQPTDQQPELEQDSLPSTSWTPEEASSLICAVWNFGILLYGPEWAADPRETIGWNISAAQLLDQVMPRGMGGAVELGAGLLLVGNGLAMMAVRRTPIIKRGPRPMWAQQRPAPAPGAPPQEAAPPQQAPEGGYKLPKELAPEVLRDESLDGAGYGL